jgi:hypothetical protein
MLFGREIDNPLRAHQRLPFGDEHVADLDFLPLAGSLICFEVLRIGFLEHQSDALPHHADGIDGVDQSLGPGLEKVAGA